MRKIILASHHRLASGMADTLAYIMPTVTNVVAIDAYMDNQPVIDQIAEVLADLTEKDEAIIFTDLLGGSVNQAFVPYASQKNIHLITGMNLPVIMTLLLALDDDPVQPDQIQYAINEGQSQLINVKDFLAKQAEALDEEDE
ncbi:MAG: PTS N-acetylglucosamine transporter subunit IIBC [Aerococcus sp.]|nr:PTS N-acetylglucosamine transporter subunit IIBC [Aerococcus sp.]